MSYGLSKESSCIVCHLKTEKKKRTLIFVFIVETRINNDRNDSCMTKIFFKILGLPESDPIFMGEKK